MQIKDQLQKIKALRSSSFFGSTLRTNLVVCCGIVILSFGIILYQGIRQIKEDALLGTSNLAYALSQNYMIYDAIVGHRAGSALIHYLDAVISNTRHMDGISILDTQRSLLYNRTPGFHDIEIPLIPAEFIGMGIIEGMCRSDSGRSARQFCSVAPILNARDKIIGYVITRVTEPTLNRIERTYQMRFLIVALITILALTASAVIISLNTKSILKGDEPAHVFSRLTEQEDIINALEEGILAIDDSGKIMLINAAAKSLLGLSDQIQPGASSASILPTFPEVGSGAGGASHNYSINISGNHLLLDELPIYKSGASIGSIRIIRNRTATVAMAEELTGSRYIVEALRSNIHNFKNELHVILGLLALGEAKAAADYISEFNSWQTTMQEALDHIQNTTIAALLIGKINEANEHGISLELEGECILPPENPFLETRQLTVILGNLIENSIDSIKEHGDMLPEKRQISLLIYCDEHRLQISVNDTGCGIAPHIQNVIFERGLSTKGSIKEGHGIGLAVIHDIVQAAGGIITLDSAPGAGTSITIYIGSKDTMPPEKAAIA